MRILIAESDRSVALFVKNALESESYAVDIASTGNEAIYMAVTADYDLVILALALPGLQGKEVLKFIRAQKKGLPVLILTYMKGMEERVECLDLGADDYMTKPFAVRELLARVRALLRRTAPLDGLNLRVADLEIDRVEHTVRRGIQKIHLTSKEFALLEYLMRNVGRPLSRAMIIEHIWDMSFDSGTNVVDVYVNYLRKKVDQGFDRKLIRTVRGVGYQIAESN